MFPKSVITFDVSLLVLSLLCTSLVQCSQHKMVAAAQSHNHHYHHQHHLHPSGNNDGTADTTNKNDRSSNSKLPWNIQEQGIGNRNKVVEQGPCRYKRCGVGRECTLNPESGQAKCSCILDCKNEEKSNKPVCGTDGRLYPSYCELRRTACLTGAHVFFSHYQHQQQQPHQHHHHQQHHEEVYHNSHYLHRQKDFYSFDIGGGNGGGGSRNGSTTHISQKHNNIIPSSDPGSSSNQQDPQCFPVVRPHHHQNQQQQRNYLHHRSHYHYDPDKNPLRDKKQGFRQPQSLLQPSAAPQHSKFLRNDEIYSAEFEDDDDDDDDNDNDEQVERNHHNSVPVISAETTQTATTASFTSLRENGYDDHKEARENHSGGMYDKADDDDIDDEEYDDFSSYRNNNDGISNNRKERKVIQEQQHHGKRQHYPPSHHHHPLHRQDFAADYPRDVIGSEKIRKISSRPTNGRLDSRHISEHGHSDLPASSYYDFMEHNKDEEQEEEEEDEMMKTSDFEERENKVKKSSWGKNENDDHDEMSDQALFHKHVGKKSTESSEPSAATNLAWKLLHQEEMIINGRGRVDDTAPPISENIANTGFSNGRNTNGHWNDPVKKGSSFVSMGRNTDDDASDVYEKSDGGFNNKRLGKAAVSASFRTISRKSTGESRMRPPPRPASHTHNVCSPQDYEILKAELFQYDMGKLMNHIKLMTSVSNDAVATDDGDNNDDATVARLRRADLGNADGATAAGRYPREVVKALDDDGKTPWSDVMMIAATTSSPPTTPPWLNMEGDGPEVDKDVLVYHIFTLLDRNHDNVLEYIELYKAEVEDTMELNSPEKTGCQFRDFLLFDDTDHDGQLHVNEFFSSFSHFYDITMISLDKALETKQTRAVEGDTVVLRCDITGSPPPYIQWKRYGTGLSQMANSGMKSNTDGTLSLTNVHMIHAGHYSCESPRNPEVVQTHIVEVETQPYVVISPKASWKRPGEELLLICRIVLPITDSPVEKEIATGHQTGMVSGSVNWVWLFNGVPLRELPKSDNNNNKYIFENSTSEDTVEISRLRLQEIYFQDMGSYSCQAENAAGIGSATASLVVIDPNSKPEVQALHNTNTKQLLVFHRSGLASYSAENCGWLWEIFGDDVLQSSTKTGKDVARDVCDQFHSVCDWGNVVQVSPNYVYAAQPSQGSILLIDVGAVQSVGNAVGIIETCVDIERLEYVPYTDQLWIRCGQDQDKGKRVLFNVVENASKGDHHKAIQFPLGQHQQQEDAPSSGGGRGSEGPVRITEIYLPSHQDGKRGKKGCQFAFVSVSDEQSLRTINLKTFTYQKNSYLNLTKFSCIPHQIHFSLSCTISIINCLDPQRKTPNGQLVVDTLTNSVRYKTSEISGNSIVSSDNRILLTEKHEGNNTHLFVQRIGVYEINLLSHFLLSNHYTNMRVVHSTITGAYASVAKLVSGKEIVISLQTGEVQTFDDLFNMVPHNSRASALYPVDSAFPLKTDKSVIVMDAETLRPRCKFYEEIPELQNFLIVQS